MCWEGAGNTIGRSTLRLAFILPGQRGKGPVSDIGPVGPFLKLPFRPVQSQPTTDKTRPPNVEEGEDGYINWTGGLVAP